MPPSPFQEQVAADLRDVFMNRDEFGQTCKWNGRDIPFAEAMPAEFVDAPGLLASTRVVTVRARDLPGEPRANERVFIDGVPYSITGIGRPLEAYVLTLSRHFS